MAFRKVDKGDTVSTFQSACFSINIRVLIAVIPDFGADGQKKSGAQSAAQGARTTMEKEPRAI
jgi:hypothetical protein